MTPKSHCVDGSSLLAFTIIITLVLFLTINSWRIALMSYELTIAKQEYTQNATATQLLIDWASNRCIKNFDAVAQLCTINRNIIITIPHWELYEHDYNARITLKGATHNSISLEAMLLKGTQSIHTMSTTINKKIKNDVVYYSIMS